MIRYLAYFLLNYTLELAVARGCLPTYGLKRLAGVFLILNLVTHPLLWFFLNRAFVDYWPRLMVAEVLVFGVEAVLALWLLKSAAVAKSRLILTVIAANLLSFSFTFLV